MKTFSLLLLLLISAISFAGPNKWVDEDGKVVYSDQLPPANVEATELRFISGAADAAGGDETAASGVPVAPKTIAEREAELRKAQRERKEVADKAAQEQADAEALREDCRAVRKNLSMLQEGMRMVEIDDKGEPYYLDDAQRQQRIVRAQKDIGTFCK